MVFLEKSDWTIFFLKGQISNMFIATEISKKVETISLGLGNLSRQQKISTYVGYHLPASNGDFNSGCQGRRGMGHNLKNIELCRK